MTSPFDSTQGLRRVDASHLRTLDITGSDAAKFMQSQFCNDQAQVSSMQAQLNGYCTPKGRLLALFASWAIDDGFRVVIPGDVRDGFIKRLRMFVLRDDVTLTPRDDLGVIGLEAVPDTTAAMPLPTDTLGVQTLDDGAQRVRWPSGDGLPARALCIAAASDSQGDGDGNDRDWRAGDIAAGLPWIRAATVDAFVPQMVNLQKVGGLSFRKGCYPGQEIVARMQYLGKLKREMRRFRAATDDCPAIGTSLAVGDDADAGQVVDAVVVGDAIELLAVVKRQYGDEFSWQGTPLTRQPLPYTLEDADAAAG